MWKRTGKSFKHRYQFCYFHGTLRINAYCGLDSDFSLYTLLPVTGASDLFALSPYRLSTMASMRIDQVKNTTREQRVAAHTHIKGLGLRDDGSAEPIAAGFVGQENAREVYRLITLCNSNHCQRT